MTVHCMRRAARNIGRATFESSVRSFGISACCRARVQAGASSEDEKNHDGRKKSPDAGFLTKVLGKSRQSEAQSSTTDRLKLKLSRFNKAKHEPRNMTSKFVPQGLGDLAVPLELGGFQFRPMPDGSFLLTARKKFLNNLGTEDPQLTAPTPDPGHSRTPIPSWWLRDQCQCGECVNPITKQRIIDTFKIPYHIKITHGEVRYDSTTIRVIWEGGHKSVFSTNWLRNAFNVGRVMHEHTGGRRPIWWSYPSMDGTPPEVDYNEVMESENGMAKWMRHVRETGFCFIEGCPPTPEATQALLERIGPIRNTHYGSFWDFTSDLAKKDMAYTSEALEPHSDTTYFSEPAGLQLFHLLEHDGQGGETQLVDGFRAALRLYQIRPDLYHTLATQRTFFHSSGNDGISIQPQAPAPILGHDPVTNRLQYIRWNNADRAAVVAEPDPQWDWNNSLFNWYSAMREFHNILQSDHKAIRYEVQLKPGRPLIFDNWRVLHGRSAFNGRRRMCGGYISRDDFISRFKTSNYGYDKILQNGIY